MAGKRVIIFKNISKCIKISYTHKYNLNVYFYYLGQGIGKNVDGIVEPIKANLKFDKTGLCYDKAVEFNDHWWERAFNCAAENLNVDNSNEAVSLSVEEEKVCI